MAVNKDTNDSRTYTFDMYKVSPSTLNTANRWPGDPLPALTWAATFWSTLIVYGTYTYSNEDIGGGAQGGTTSFGTEIHFPGAQIRFCDHSSVNTDSWKGIIANPSAATSDETYTVDKT